MQFGLPVHVCFFVAVRAGFIKPWKYTSPSVNYTKSGEFVATYLAGRFYDDFYYYAEHNRTAEPQEECVEAEWLIWESASPGKQNPSSNEFCEDFHLHFVSLRNEGPLSQSIFEKMLLRISEDETRYTAFMDTHVTFEASELDPIVGPLLSDGIPVFGHTNSDGSYSVFVRVMHGPVIEITSFRFSLANLSAGGHCMAMPVRLTGEAVDWARVDQYKDDAWIQRQREQWQRGQPQNRWRFNLFLERRVPPEWPNMLPKRFSFASTQPAASAALFASVLQGELFEECIGEGTQIHGVRLSDRSGSNFELVWINRPFDKQGSVALAKFEHYIKTLRGNLSERSWRNWEHFMDYHVGLIFDECKPILSRLETSSVEYFLAAQGSGKEEVVSLFFQDRTGVLFEIVCMDWHPTEEANEPDDFWFESCNEDPDELHNVALVRSLASQLQGYGKFLALDDRIPCNISDWVLALRVSSLVFVAASIGICMYQLWRRWKGC